MYGISAVRRNGSRSGRIDEVLMGMLARDARGWDMEPTPAPVKEVIDRILNGDAVVAVVPAGDGSLVHGPRAQVRLVEEGPVEEESIAFPEAPGSPRLDELSRY
ncbi:hypothetical protein [Xylophilus sp.]|uniref:hypothetical protein n=1 Tax=Xylophilus sp. TaxID=2653893 RepID=UPI0013BD466B|nr:hypothetical protein [Xylophilus sp.]KAF1049462.1 MAG: hypothetical protein GAK38_00554 [Xylophilus sp.]